MSRPRLIARCEEPFGERGLFFRLSAGLIDLIRSVGIAKILEGTSFDATYATQLLAFTEGMDWSGRPDFVLFSWNQRCTLPMPSGASAEAETGADGGSAASSPADATIAVDVESAVDTVDAGDTCGLLADADVAPPRDAGTGAGRSVVETAVPARG